MSDLSIPMSNEQEMSSSGIPFVPEFLVVFLVFLTKQKERSKLELNNNDKA